MTCVCAGILDNSNGLSTRSHRRIAQCRVPHRQRLPVACDPNAIVRPRRQVSGDGRNPVPKKLSDGEGPDV
jgi:hypothetical protein